MAKDTSSKKLSTKKSTERLSSSSTTTKKAQKDKDAAAPSTTTKLSLVVAAPAAAAPAKSLKRKQQDEPAAAASTTSAPANEKDVKEPASKKGKVKANSEDKKGKAAAVAAPTPAPAAVVAPPPPSKESTKPKAPERLKYAPKPPVKKLSAKAMAKAKVPASRKKQAPPRPVAPSSDEGEDDDAEAEVESADEAVPSKEQKKEAAPAAAASSDEEAEEDEDEEEMLHGFSTDEDSSDEEDGGAMDQDSKPFDVEKLPTIAKDDATVKAKLDKAKKKPTEDRGVLYLGRIPHGFYEDQMKAYFTQFGEVTRVRISRNKKTGKSKHYGFVEFDSSSVAKIVAETMDNYLMNGHLMQCKVIPKDKVHPQLWVGANRKWRAVPMEQVVRAKHNKKRDEESREAIAKRLVKRENQRKRKLQEMGITYDFDAVSYKKSKATTTKA